VEMPLSVLDLENAVEEIREELVGFDVISVDFSEQSDKDFVIMRILLKVPMGKDWRIVKSEALRRLLRYRERKIRENVHKYLCLTKGVSCENFLTLLQSSS